MGRNARRRPAGAVAMVYEPHTTHRPSHACLCLRRRRRRRPAPPGRARGAVQEGDAAAGEGRPAARAHLRRQDAHPRPRRGHRRVRTDAGHRPEPAVRRPDARPGQRPAHGRQQPGVGGERPPAAQAVQAPGCCAASASAAGSCWPPRTWPASPPGGGGGATPASTPWRSGRPGQPPRPSTRADPSRPDHLPGPLPGEARARLLARHPRRPDLGSAPQQPPADVGGRVPSRRSNPVQSRPRRLVGLVGGHRRAYGPSNDQRPEQDPGRPAGSSDGLRPVPRAGRGACRPRRAPSRGCAPT